ncbi:hypothetical protein CIP101434_02375 [Corynebacterium diphtheriae]|nr:hypothetical protein CIP101280_02086 [Corynebacterium diphtheriae]CAB0530780.1 hypothetical protein CIP101434_02375 [Corynebacterium diphtheriae]CAB0917172.1 hypothetical protein FRC0430_02014 [Corynebacterium diphtheriae]CAB0969375.1 hypothetical protein FRC0436_02013 [Corynebacterium diphtheriae]
MSPFFDMRNVLSQSNFWGAVHLRFGLCCLLEKHHGAIGRFPQIQDRAAWLPLAICIASRSTPATCSCRAYLGSADFRFEYLPHPAVGDAKKVGNIAVVVPTIR